MSAKPEGESSEQSLAPANPRAIVPVRPGVFGRRAAGEFGAKFVAAVRTMPVQMAARVAGQLIEHPQMAVQVAQELGVIAKPAAKTQIEVKQSDPKPDPKKEPKYDLKAAEAAFHRAFEWAKRFRNPFDPWQEVDAFKHLGVDMAGVNLRVDHIADHLYNFDRGGIRHYAAQLNRLWVQSAEGDELAANEYREMRKRGLFKSYDQTGLDVVVAKGVVVQQGAEIKDAIGLMWEKAVSNPSLGSEFQSFCDLARLGHDLSGGTYGVGDILDMAVAKYQGFKETFRALDYDLHLVRTLAICGDLDRALQIARAVPSDSRHFAMYREIFTQQGARGLWEQAVETSDLGLSVDAKYWPAEQENFQAMRATALYKVGERQSAFDIFNQYHGRTRPEMRAPDMVQSIIGWVDFLKQSGNADLIDRTYSQALEIALRQQNSDKLSALWPMIKTGLSCGDLGRTAPLIDRLYQAEQALYRGPRLYTSLEFQRRLAVAYAGGFPTSLLK